MCQALSFPPRTQWGAKAAPVSDLMEFKVLGSGWEDGHSPNGRSNTCEVSGSVIHVKGSVVEWGLRPGPSASWAGSSGQRLELSPEGRAGCEQAKVLEAGEWVRRTGREG